MTNNNPDELAPTPWIGASGNLSVYSANGNKIFTMVLPKTGDALTEMALLRNRIVSAFNAVQGICWDALENGAIQGVSEFIRGVGYFNFGHDCGTCDYPVDDCDASAESEHCIGAEARQLLAELACNETP